MKVRLVSPIYKKGEGRFVANGSLSRIAGAILVLVTLLLTSCGVTLSEPAPTLKPMSYSAPPPMTIDTSKQYTATIETGKGNIVLELFASDVSVTVNNFVFLAREGFYNDTTFHRVIPDFMAQGGDPTGTGTGGPGYKFADELTEHTHVTGALSMAHAGPNTNGSQFFITYTPQHHLDGHHSVFGQLVDGMDVLEALKNGDAIVRITIEER
jgi:peptidyl-prolyl cis-trans isomerase B (cyclophilin B)